MGRGGENEVARENEEDHRMDDACSRYGECCLERGSVGVFGWIGSRWSCSWEEDEKEKETANVSRFQVSKESMEVPTLW
jgi:hypothetical protein